MLVLGDLHNSNSSIITVIHLNINLIRISNILSNINGIWCGERQEFRNKSVLNQLEEIEIPVEKDH